MFLFKKEKIVLTAYTDDPTLLEMFPVIEANKNYPAYYKTLESKFQKLNKMNERTLPHTHRAKETWERSFLKANSFMLLVTKR